MTVSPASTAIEPAVVSAGAEERCGDSDDVFEQRLIADARAGCAESFRILVERYQDRVFRFCCQLLNCTEDAREACQDTFVQAYRALPRYRVRGRARFSTWLFQIALNLCRDGLRARAARKRQHPETIAAGGNSPLGEEPACPRLGPDETLAYSENLEKLVRGIEALPLRLREVLVLATVEGLSHEASGQILGCSPRAVEGRLYRARRELLDWWNAET